MNELADGREARRLRDRPGDDAVADRGDREAVGHAHRQLALRVARRRSRRLLCDDDGAGERKSKSDQWSASHGASSAESGDVAIVAENRAAHLKKPMEHIRYSVAACQTDMPNPIERRSDAIEHRSDLDMIDAAVAGSAPFLPVRLVVFPEFAHAAPVFPTVRELLQKLTVRSRTSTPSA